MSLCALVLVVFANVPRKDRIKQSSVDSLREADEAVDATPQIFLSQLPGVLPGNRRAIMERAGTLRNLLTGWNEAEYASIMGANNAAALDNFLKTRYHREADEGAGAK